jgi:hypothetical protein
MNQMREPGEWTELTAAARARKGEILRAAERALRRRVIRRRAMGGVAGAAACVLLAGGAMLALRADAPAPASPVPMAAGGADAQHRAQDPEGAALQPGETALTANTRAAEHHAAGTPRLAIVGDDPGIVERLRADERPRLTAAIDDDGLLELLHAAGRPEGLIRAGGRVMLSSEVQQMAEAQRIPGNG